MPADRLVILHAPMHAPDATPQVGMLAVRQGSDSWSPSEAFRLYPWLRRRVRYRCTVTRTPIDTRIVHSPMGDAGDNPILSLRRWKKVDEFAQQACRASVPIKIAPARWVYGVAYDHPFGVVEHISAHPNAAVRGLTLRVDRVRKYAASMRVLEYRIKTAMAKGRLVVVTGDLNHPEGGPRWAPGPTFARCGLRSWRIGIDWVAFSPELELVERRVIPPSVTGQDHPWMRAAFVRRGA